ncbi:MAG TPA: serine hydrolase domain-containing protein [Cyclobacteriaceae bacterium]
MRKYFLFVLVSVLCACKDDKLDKLFSSQIKEDGPGASILIMKGDSVIFSKSYGLADLNTKEPITGKTLFNVGSITKTFVMNSILMLRDEGKLSLEDSLIKYFPDFKNKDIARKVKIKHLLTHTSGLPDLRPVQAQREFYLTADDAQNWAPIMQADSLEFEPASRYKYSNPAFNALALIIEKTSGQPWRQFVAERIFKPAGMTTSTITDGSHPETGVSHGYVMENDKWTELDFGEEPTFCAAGNGGVWSSTEELFKYYKALEGATFSNKATIAESMEEKSFGIGWSWFVGKTNDGLKTVGHTGTQGGFYCDYVMIPEKKIVYIMLANFPIDRSLLNREVLRILGSPANLTENVPA